jgi:hypothetical protein
MIRACLAAALIGPAALLYAPELVARLIVTLSQ